jgi:hypothetical protein
MPEPVLQVAKAYLDDGRQVRVTVVADAKAFGRHKRAVARGVRVPGFRAGRAPYEAARRQVGETWLVERAMLAFLNEVYDQVLSEIDEEIRGPRSAPKLRDSDPPTLEFTIPIRQRPLSERIPEGAPLEAWPRLTRRRVLARLREYFDSGYRDPELLYLGGRYALSLGMRKEARRFLEPLAETIQFEQAGSQRKSVPKGYAPVGLLLAAAEVGPLRREIEGQLAEAADSNARLQDLLSAPPRPQGNGRDVASEALTMLAQRAREHYEANELDPARAALESMLLTDSDQPAVLRNLITVTSEQHDVEAYERYWRRYIKILLWRLSRDQEIDATWEQLLRFYTHVAELTDRDLDGTPDEVRALITQPGFLPRWLEAHTGLIWLESALKSRRTLQTNLTTHDLEQGWIGNLGLMHTWLRLFYPEFEGLVDVGRNTGDGLALPSGEAQLQIYFDPTLTLLKRFLEWHRIGFGLSTTPTVDEASGQEGRQLVHDRHADNIVALAECVARIPSQHYTLDLTTVLEEERTRATEQTDLRQVLQDACGLPFFQFRLAAYLEDPPDWQGLIDFFGDPEMAPRLAPPVRLFLALAFCQRERCLEGLRTACNVVPEIPPEEFEEETQNRNLWESVLNANIGHAVQAEEKPEILPRGVKVPAKASPAEAWIVLVKHEIGKIRGDKRTLAIRKEALDLVESVYTRRILVDKAVEKSQALVADHKFEEALRVVAELPDKPEDLQELKENLSGQIREAQSSYTLNEQIESAVELSKMCVEDGDFDGARGIIEELPDEPAEVSDLKDRLLSQIDEVEEHHQLQARIDEAIGKSKAYVEQGNFHQARRAVTALPDRPAELKELKENLLSQIEQAEAHHSLQAQIEEAVEESKTQVRKGNFRQARRAVNALPDSPQEVKELKQNLLSQIREAEEQHGLQDKIDRAVAKSKEYVQKGDFASARREIRRLPDSPAEVKKLKRNLLSQIDDVEDDLKSVDRTINELIEKFNRRGVDWSAVAKIAQDNDVDISNKPQFAALLKAIDEQLF